MAVVFDFLKKNEAAVSGTAKVAGLLTATDGGTTYQWYRADDTSGTNLEAINGARYKVYWPGDNDTGKYLRVSVDGIFSSYTSLVTTIIVMQDDFNYGHNQSFDVAKWTETDPVDAVGMGQQGGKLKISTSSGSDALFSNEVVSVATIDTGTIAAVFTETNPNGGALSFSLRWDADNMISIRRTGGTSFARLLVTVAGVSEYVLDTAYAFDGKWKIVYDSSTGVISFKQYDSTTQSWTLIGSYTNTFAGSANAVISAASSSGTSTFDDFFMTSEDYDLSVPERFDPPTTSNALTEEYQSWRMGWFIHNPYYLLYTVPEGDINGDWSDPRTHMNIDFNWATIAAQMTQGEYVIIQAKVERGFRYFNVSTIDQYNAGATHSLDGVTVPQYGFDYAMNHATITGLALDADMLQTAVDAFVAQGKRVGLYYSLGKDINYRNTITGTGTGTDANYAYEYASLAEREIIYLIENITNIHFIWFDFARLGSSQPWPGNIDDVIRLYQKIKRINSSIIVISSWSAANLSLYSAASLKYFPSDVITFESTSQPSPTSEISTEESNYGGTSYFIPREIAYTGLYRDTNTIQWPWLEDVYWSPSVVNKIKTQSEFQTIYDTAKGYGVPLSVNVPIKHDGTLDATYVSRVNGIML